MKLNDVKSMLNLCSPRKHCRSGAFVLTIRWTEFFSGALGIGSVSKEVKAKKAPVPRSSPPLRRRWDGAARLNGSQPRRGGAKGEFRCVNVCCSLRKFLL